MKLATPLRYYLLNSFSNLITSSGQSLHPIKLNPHRYDFVTPPIPPVCVCYLGHWTFLCTCHGSALLAVSGWPAFHHSYAPWLTDWGPGMRWWVTRGEEGQSCFVRDDMIWVDVVVVRVVRRKCNNRESSGTKKPKSEAPSEWYALITGVHTDWPTLSPFPVTTCSNCSWLETLAWASRVCCFVFRWVPVKWLAFMVIIISNLYIRLFQDDTYTESYISTIGVDFVSTS